jgi:dihydrofolate reductase (trimethoprim resistance protein)
MNKLKNWSKVVEKCLDEYMLEKARQPQPTFNRGDRVRKRSGSAWQGRVVGEYSTALTPDGYAVESEAHPGSVQIYPASALEDV